MSLVPKELLILETDPESCRQPRTDAVLGERHGSAASLVNTNSQSLLTCFLYKCEVNKQRRKPEKLAEVLKVPLRPLTSAQRPAAQGEPPSDFVLVHSSVNSSNLDQTLQMDSRINY